MKLLSPAIGLGGEGVGKIFFSSELCNSHPMFQLSLTCCYFVSIAKPMPAPNKPHISPKPGAQKAASVKKTPEQQPRGSRLYPSPNSTGICLISVNREEKSDVTLPW